MKFKFVLLYLIFANHQIIHSIQTRSECKEIHISSKQLDVLVQSLHDRFSL